MPIALVLLIGLFFLQKRGTTKVGALFAPIMLLYFIDAGVLGVAHIFDYPGKSWPRSIRGTRSSSSSIDKTLAFLALGSVVLAVTGAEALYSDMGHFGRGPMRLSWFGFVMPCLLLNYFGQGAMIISLGDASAAQAITNPFFFMAPDMLAPAAGAARHRGDASSPARR